MNLAETFSPIVAEWKSSPRFRWGVWGIVGLLWVYGVLDLRDQVGRKGNDYRALGQKVQRARSIATQEEWILRRDEARTLALAWEERLWREGTIGLAQASFHDRLRQLVAESGLTGVQLSLAAQEDEGSEGKSSRAGIQKDSGPVPGLWKVSAKLAFDFRPQKFYSMLARLASTERSVVIDSLLIRSTPSPKAEIRLVAYFQEPVSVNTAEGTATGGQK